MSMCNNFMKKNKRKGLLLGLPPKLMFFGFFLLFMFVSSADIFARSTWQDNNTYFSASYDKEKCAVKIVLRQGDDQFGPANENGYIENATVKYNNNVICRISAYDVNDELSVEGSGMGIVRYSINKSGSIATLTILWYPNEVISNGGVVSINGTWDVNGAYGGDEMAGSRTITDIPALTSISYKSTSFNTEKKQTTISFASSSSEAFNKNGKYYLYRTNSSSPVKEVGPIDKSGSFVLDDISSQANEYYIEYKWTNEGLDYISKSSTFTVDAFTFPKDLNLSFDDRERTVSLKWGMTTVTGSNYVGYGYEVQRANGADKQWVTIAEIDYDPNLANVTYVDDYYVGSAVTGEFYYRVRRKDGSSSWDNLHKDLYKESSIYLSTEHMDFNPNSLKMNIDDETGLVTLTWDLNGNSLWSTGSQFVLTKRNLTNNSKDDIELSKEDLERREYVDEFINSCVKYRYALKVKPGGIYETETLETEPFVWSRIADMSSLSVSKGYFKDYVELNWSADFTGGDFDHFEIERKVHGESDDKYKLLESVSASLSINDYVWKDQHCIAGIVYDYRVTGVLLCAGEKKLSSYRPVSVGYISPKGEIYGRTTFESGQGVADVMMQLSTNAALNGISSRFDGKEGDYLETYNNLSLTGDFSMQLMVAPSEKNADGVLFKYGDVVLGLNGGKPYFKSSSKNIQSDFSLDKDKFATVAVVYKKCDELSEDSLFIYVIKDEITVSKNSVPRFSLGENKLVVGQEFNGNIDEVRIWNVALDRSTLEKDYYRYLVGNENGLILYWGFDEPVEDEVYDSSYGKVRHNENHGMVVGNVVKDDTRHPAMLEYSYRKPLSYCGKTDVSGNYRIAGIPYEGSGTEYTVTPLFGVHQFAPTSKTVVIGESSSIFNIDFVDMSSFDVQGYVYYNNSDIPVKDVMFYIDGQVAAKSNGEMITSDENGQFTISVPVGVHEVKAVKTNHVFANDGKLVNSYGADLNYQDDMSNVRFWDETTVKVIGKVVGGYKQYECPTGFSLSKNNLGDEVYMKLELKELGGEGFEKDSTEVVDHFVDGYSNKVTFSGKTVRIDMDKTTGEFVANLLPEKYSITDIFATGYGNQIEDVAEDLDLTNVFVENYSKAEGDTLFVNDSIMYNKEFSYQLNVAPVFKYVEVTDSIDMKPKEYFGSSSMNQVYYLDGENKNVTIDFWDREKKVYNFDKPVFKQGGWYYIKVDTYYPFYYNNDKDNGDLDIIPVKSGKAKFVNTIKNENVDLDINANGECLYSFQASNIDINGVDKGLRSLQISVVGDGQPAGSSVSFDGYVLGLQNRGSDFITQGPNNLLYVLRDPPGSNSFATLEKGMTFTNTLSEISNGFYLNGETKLDYLLGFKLSTSVGVGVETETELESENSVGVVVEEHNEGQTTDTSVKEFTTTSVVSTSGTPLYVGADGDVLVGYSTNMIISAADEMTIKRREHLNVSDIEIADFGDYVLCKTATLSIAQKFATMFAYPQVHIEQVIIPQLENMISSYLRFDLSADEAQKEADATNKPVYVSKLSPDDPNFGLPNPGTIIEEDGDFYTIYFPASFKDEEKVDQVDSCYNSIKRWVDVLAQNEEMKVKAFDSEDVKNYSFQAGASISESYAFSNTKTRTKEFNYTIGTGPAIALGYKVNGLGYRMETKYVEGVVGGNSSEDSETSNSVYSFTLAEDGDYDYLSVDVINVAENTKENADMVFRLRGGATACPYEGEQYTKYFEPGMHKLSEGSLRIEKPSITAEPAEVFNVPSNSPAVFTLRMTNLSETGSSSWMTLRLVDESIPNGAKLSIDGVPLSDGRTFLIPSGDYLVKTLEVYAGANAYDYENMQIVLGSQCQCDPTGFQEVISDTVSLSAHFIPTSTEVHIKSPGNNWTLNTECDVEDGKYYLPITIYDYDINYRGFDRIEIQYKPKSESKQWNVLRTFYKNEEDVTDPETEEWIDRNITLTANFFGEEDQDYDIRAVSYCDYSLDGGESTSQVTYQSETISGVKDTKRPVLFGNPLPADGILDVEDEVRLNFSEDIADGYLTASNFEVTAVKNGSESDHSVSVRLNGDNEYITTEFDKNLSGKNLTVDMWVMPEDLNRAGTFFAHGQGEQVFEVGMDGNGHLIVRVGTQTYTSDVVDFKEGNWSHIMVAYSAENNMLLAYYNFDNIVLNEQNVPVYEGVGVFQFGRSANGGNYYKGNMHDFRLWDAFVSVEDIKENNLKVLSGLEPSLMLYYPMNEGRGNELTEKARGNTAILKGAWNTPEGRAVNFSGESYMVINSSEIPVKEEQNFTLEFWFKTNATDVNNQAIINNGLADGTDLADASDLFYIGFDGSNRLFFRSNKETVLTEGNFADMQWHHFAVTVNRNAANAQIYIDGILNTYFKTDSIGGISGANIYVGASGYYENNLNTVYANHFNGNVDEIRIWNSHMTQNDINRNSNVQAKGTELGLMAYYPFEKYITNSSNIQELVFTTEDMVGKKYSAELFAGAAETNEKAPLKSKGTESFILHNFVVNKDALIITLTEPEDRIEKTIVNFAVKNVRDINGNKMEDVVRWSAYVDRNQLRWSESEIRIEKEQYEPMEFEVDLNNVGGSIKSYTIEGLPSWLTANPESGQLDPKATQHITFTINEGTNVGSYDEVVYAVGENGVAEPLNIQVKVNGIKPDWSVNPSDFEYSMTVFGKMRFAGIFSSDTEDMLAAFEGGKCIGVANSSYDKDQDMWYAFLTVYNNKQNSDNIEFRMWDASTGKIYSANPDEAISFVSGSIVGTAKEPVIFDGKEIIYQNVSLASGWNWISFNLHNNNLSDVDATLSNGVWSAGDQVKDNNNKAFASYSTKKGWVSDGLTFDNITSYLLYTANEQSLSVSGNEVDVTSTMIPVRNGRWNYISYLPLVNMTVKEALAGYEAMENDVVRSQNQFAMYTGKSWIGNLTYMESGKGYMLYRNAGNDTQFHYPSVQGSLGGGQKIAGKRYASFLNTNYAENMNIIAVGESLQPEDKVLAYVNGELRGVSDYVLSDNGGLHFINISGEGSGERVMFALERNGEVVAYANNSVNYNSKDVLGTTNEPYVLDFSEKESNVSVYPTPFDKQLNIDVVAENGDEIRITVYNSLGQTVYSNYEVMPYNGTYVMIWDGNTNGGIRCDSGVYFVRVDINGEIKTCKVEKIN